MLSCWRFHSRNSPRISAHARREILLAKRNPIWPKRGLTKESTSRDVPAGVAESGVCACVCVGVSVWQRGAFADAGLAACCCLGQVLRWEGAWHGLTWLGGPFRVSPCMAKCRALLLHAPNRAYGKRV